jgi:hypothetical protein
LFAISAVGLCFNCSLLRAAEDSDRVVIEADDVDVAKAQSGSVVVFVSSGQRLAVSHAIDGDRRTIFQFSSSDPRPTLIIKLIENKLVHRVGVVVGSETGKVDVYLLGQIPRDPSELDKMKPVTSIVDFGVAHEATADFAPQDASYVALRWALSSNHVRPPAVAEVSVFSHSASDPSVVTLAAFGPPPELVQGPPMIASVSP